MQRHSDPPCPALKTEIPSLNKRLRSCHTPSRIRQRYQNCGRAHFTVSKSPTPAWRRFHAREFPVLPIYRNSGRCSDRRGRQLQGCDANLSHPVGGHVNMLGFIAAFLAIANIPIARISVNSIIGRRTRTNPLGNASGGCAASSHPTTPNAFYRSMAPLRLTSVSASIGWERQSIDSR